KLVEEKKIEEIVLGWPLRMDGSEGRRADITREFSLWLEKVTGKKVIFWDERLTTQQAQRKMEAFKGSPKEKKQKEDQLAAVIILEAYLDKKRHDADNTQENS
ncbi:MAG: Holliday junction resolvase RuvX, partial [Candidatus Saccharicenans sp.]|nr:Holliday junction resolvase RuvX [Candidatus Saccharicenans sp.]